MAICRRWEDDPDAALADAVTILRQNGVLVFPTETVYGIGVSQESSVALERMRTIKGRDANKPFQVLIDDIEQAEALAAELTDEARCLMKAFWPGPLTLVLPAKSGGTVGLRMPDHPVIRALIRALGAPVIASSANHAGEPPACTAPQALEALGQEVDLVLDAGAAAVGEASSVVSLENGQLRIFREGAISEHALQMCLMTCGDQRG